MPLTRVTITGADDGTDIKNLIELSRIYPFVEWAILVTKKREGTPRYPSRNWIDNFAASASVHRLNVATHVCGKYVRDLLIGELNWRDLPACVDVSKRIQINTHGEPHISTTGMLRNLFDGQNFGKSKEFIFQFDGINNHLPYAAMAYGINVSALYDASGGAGILPTGWQPPAYEFWCGYAGGLGPSNVLEQVQEIAKVCNGPYWIDMETRVRTDDNKNLDLNKVEQVLSLMNKFMKDQI